MKIEKLLVWETYKKIGALNLMALYSLGTSGPLFSDGWFRSYKEKASIDANGNPLPWITYPAIEFIKKRLNKELVVFEFGAGGSTLWWACKVKSVISVEHDAAWYESIIKKLPENVSIRYIDLALGSHYSSSIKDYKDYFHIIVIDGRDRVNCMKNCIEPLKANGVIILDNSDRIEYKDGIEYLKSNGFRSIEFTGYCPIVNLKTETSIFYRSSNIFEI